MPSLSNVIEFPRRQEPDLQPDSRRAVAEERQRIARELHDVVSYGFATITLNAGVALQTLNEQPQQAEYALEAIKAASKEALRELRGILGMLRAAEADERSAPGLGRVDELVASMTAAGVRTQAHVEGRPRPLPAAVDVAAFRIVQEALANVLRHAGRASAFVRITYGREALIVQIEDDGDGAASSRKPSEGSGHGLIGMRERVRALGGQLEAGPGRDRGFRVRAHLPVLGRP